MSKRIEAERIFPLDENCIFPNGSVVAWIGIVKEGFCEEAAMSHAVVLAIIEMERTTVAPSFGLSLSSFDIKDGTFQRDNLLGAEGVEAAKIILQLSTWMHWK